MNKYQKGARFERDIIRKFWAHGWSAIRAAGSGSIGFPVPDVIAIKSGKILIIECKTSRKEKLNVKKAVLELKKFSDISSGDAFIAIKFHKGSPRFYSIEELMSRKNYSVSVTDRYLSLEALIAHQLTL